MKTKPKEYGYAVKKTLVFLNYHLPEISLTLKYMYIW